MATAASVSFSCPPCGVRFTFYGEGGGPYLQGVIDALIEEHAGHAFDMIEQSAGILSIKEDYAEWKRRYTVPSDD
jgi:hypothetical protein